MRLRAHIRDSPNKVFIHEATQPAWIKSVALDCADQVTEIVPFGPQLKPATLFAKAPVRQFL
eukprot:7698298-Alexandrium_andersonii.AAC.2